MILEKTQQYFANFPSLKILFLFDEAQEFLEEVQQIKSEDFKVLFWENNPFTLKYQLTHELQSQKVLLYLNLPQPSSQKMYHNFPLMGLLLANKELQLDNVGAFIEEFGLQRHQKSMISKYMSELKYASVKEVVKPILVSGNFQEKELQQGLLSAFLKFKNVENWVVLITKLCILAQEENEATFSRVRQKIKITNLQDIIVDKVKQHLGYTLKAFTAEEFLQASKTVLYNYTMQNSRPTQKDAYSSLKISDVSQLTAINQFWQIVENSPLVSNGFYELLQAIQKDIKGEQLVSAYGIEENYAYYPNNLTWAILAELQDKIIGNDEIGLKILENLALQQEIQGAAKDTIRFLRHVLKTTLAIDNIATYSLNLPEEYIANYTNDHYKIDTNYRRAILYIDEMDTVEVPDNINLEQLQNHLNETYNKHVDQLNRQWLQCLSRVDFKYSNIQTPKQYDFYNTEVAQVEQKLVVIISDALRYEVGTELLSKMHGDTKNTAEIRHMLASIPSKTSVGMAQLLPGEKKFNGGDILSDGISTASTYRTRLLQAYKDNAEAVKFEAVKNASQKENRALFKNDLVYIYHDVIDAIGDKRPSERKSFDAVRTAISELERFIKLLHGSYNVSNVLITADHGFLYNDKKIEDKELETLPSDTLLSHNRFFITKENHENELGYTLPLKQTTAFKEEAFVHIPFSVNRYRKSGVGHQFVHCGASLQELIVPLIVSSRKRVEFAKKVNPTLLNKGKLRVVSNILKFNILQENEVSRLEKERTIIVALYKETTLVSNTVDVVLNSTSEAPSDRLTNIELIVMPEFSSESVLKLKVFDTDDKLNPLIEELVINNTLLGQDFLAMSLKEKIIKHFEGKVVRKDLTSIVKGSNPVPVYVLEYLLGQYCAIDDKDVIAAGIEKVKNIIRDNYVHRSDAEIVKAKIRDSGSHKIIDKITVSLNDKANIYEAEFASLGLRGVPIADKMVMDNQKLLSGGGVWCILTVGYSHADDISMRWIIIDLKPIQIASVNLEEYVNLRKEFTTDEWLDLLMHSIGLNPEYFNKRDKLIQLSRLIPHVENNYNFIELGPKGTGKSHIFSELSPHGVLVSGGDVSKARLFVNNTGNKIGLVGYWDVVALDEFEQEKGGKRTDGDLVKIMQNYMANQSFNRGKETYQATASMAFVGNTKHNVPYMLKNSHLFESIPEGYLKGAFLDRMHMYIPGWEVSILKTSVFSSEYGFIVDYLAELLRVMRKSDFSSILDGKVALDGSLTTRDKTAIRKSFSGLVKIIYPHQELTDEEIFELLDFCIEGRKRVKDQLYIIDETFRSEPVEFKYTILSSGKEVFPETLENLNYKAAVEIQEESKEDTPETRTEKPKLNLQPHQVIIKDNQTGISYKKLFANYLKGASYITIQDPYIRMYYQFNNLLEFCVMLGNNKEPEEEINLEIVTWNHEEYMNDSIALFDDLIAAVQSLGINLTYKMEQHHDRFIAADNGWKINLGRGLDIFEKTEGRFNVADLDQSRRKCRSCEVTYLKI